MLWETIRLAVQAICCNALRSILTVLGMVIGGGAVVAMVTVWQGATEQVTADVEKLGTNMLLALALSAAAGVVSGFFPARHQPD